MHDFRLTTPVVFIVFNRPATTARVFDAIRQAKPPQLLIVADGPRAHFAQDAEKCAAVRTIIQQTDWECKVLKNYSDVNLGCKQRISSGLAWVFSMVEEAIILEDDCLPHPTFFRFCQELLERYRNNEQIRHISGDNFQFGRQYGNSSYYFSRYAHIWGWATWRRAWQNYNVTISSWLEPKTQQLILERFSNPKERRFWKHTFDLVAAGKMDTWDYQWLYTCFLNNGLCINPNINLITNIGFGGDATHTKPSDNPLSLPSSDMTFPLIHPDLMKVNADADENVAALFFHRQSALPRAIQRLRQLV